VSEPPVKELYAQRDQQFRDECDAVELVDCDRFGAPGNECKGCPAWEGLKARLVAKTTAGEEPGVLVRRSSP
jgi:hypothetical protein